MSIVAQKLMKSFAGVTVLNGVDIALEQGEVHALLGANGSGKSTLVKILTGVYQPDAGSIKIGDRVVSAIASPHEAAASGIAVVHQEAPLIDTLSVAECMAVFRGYPTHAWGGVDWRRLTRDADALLERFQIPISSRTLARKLSPAQRALVALVIALDQVKTGVELLILDEVTASLPEDQAKIFLDRVGQIAANGTAVLMVTHRLAELHGLAKSVTVLRGGQVVHAGPAAQAPDEALVAHMVGEGFGAAVTESDAARGSVRRLWGAAGDREAEPRPLADAPALQVQGLSGEYLRETTFSLRAGEIVGVAGLVDGGVAELPQILGGLAKPSGGEIRVAGRLLSRNATPREALDAGLAVLPADRLRNGGVMTLSVAENVVLPQFDRLWGRRRRENELLHNVISVLDVRPPSGRALFGKLSGGNQQKALLGKWLLMKPRVLVLDDPTSGVDPGARRKIFEVLRDAAHSGVGILLFSTEPEQLASVCSRVLVLRGGQVVAELEGQALGRETISKWCYA
jgi:ribose transport system ATP-binding protein